MLDCSCPQYLAIGQIVKPWGIRGMVKVEILSDFPERFTGLERVYIQGEPHQVEESRLQGGMAVIKLMGCESRDQAESLRGALLEIPVETAAALPPGKYYVHQIVGLETWTSKGVFLGRVSEVLRTGANDVYVIEDGGKEILIPAIQGVVLEVDLTGSRLLVEPLEEDWA